MIVVSVIIYDNNQQNKSHVNIKPVRRFTTKVITPSISRNMQYYMASIPTLFYLSYCSHCSCCFYSSEKRNINPRHVPKNTCLGDFWSLAQAVHIPFSTPSYHLNWCSILIKTLQSTFTCIILELFSSKKIYVKPSRTMKSGVCSGLIKFCKALWIARRLTRLV